MRRAMCTPSMISVYKNKSSSNSIYQKLDRVRYEINSGKDLTFSHTLCKRGKKQGKGKKANKEAKSEREATKRETKKVAVRYEVLYALVF